jgi:hypothetical protein
MDFLRFSIQPLDESRQVICRSMQPAETGPFRIALRNTLTWKNFRPVSAGRLKRIVFEQPALTRLEPSELRGAGPAGARPGVAPTRIVRQRSYCREVWLSRAIPARAGYAGPGVQWRGDQKSNDRPTQNATNWRGRQGGQLWALLSEGVGITAGVPQIAADLVHRASRQARANTRHRNGADLERFDHVARQRALR